MENMDRNPVYKTGGGAPVYLSLLSTEGDRTSSSPPEPPPPRPSGTQEGCYEVLPGDFGEPPHAAAKNSVQTTEQPKGTTFGKNEGKPKRKTVVIIVSIAAVVCVTAIAVTLLVVYLRMPVSDPDITEGDEGNLERPVAGKIS